jgi:hypothetical protein
MAQKRKFTRVEFQTQVTIEVSGRRQIGQTINLSQGGVLIHTTPVPEFGQKLTLEIQLPKIKAACVIPGVVRWNRDSSVGIQFEELRAIEVWGINQIVSCNK